MRAEAIPIKLGTDEKDCPPFERASHMAVCTTCRETYIRHQIYAWGEHAPYLYLFKTCDGRFWKL